MTIIATKDGIMACDSTAYVGELIVPVMRPKIIQRRDGAIFGAGGDTVNCDIAREWFMAGEKYIPELRGEHDSGALSFIILRPDGRVFRGNSYFEMYETPSLYAIGYESASLITMGAMLAGATVRQAVKIAIDNCVYVGGEVFSISL